MYSDDARSREQVRLALGKRMHPELSELSYVEVATGPMVIRQVENGGIDLAILDGEATPVGGMGIAKQLKDEIDDCPPIVVLTGPARRRLAGEVVTCRGCCCPCPSIRSSSPTPWWGSCAGRWVTPSRRLCPPLFRLWVRSRGGSTARFRHTSATQQGAS